MLVSNSTTLLPFSWGIGYYAVLLLTLAYLFLRGMARPNLLMLALYIVCALSIALNDIPSFFAPWPRLGTFVLLTAVVSPAFGGKGAAAFRVQMFAAVSILLSVVTLVSTGMLLTGQGYGVMHAWFQGATVHSMIMGPVAAASNLFCLYQLQYKIRRGWMKALYVALLGGGFLCILQTGSRSSLIGALVSAAAFLFFRHKDNVGQMVKKAMLCLVVLLLASPVWMPYTNKIIEKNAGDSSSLNTDSRSVYWEQRLVEWKSSPVYGIGFSTVDAEAEGSTFDKETGGVETGSSWLSALSMTGILGFACVVGLFCSAFLRSWRLIRRTAAVGAFLLSMLLFFIFHMMAEGYIFAGGNFLNTQLWLLLGVIFSVSQYPKYAELLERKLQLH